ncbi:uncharacterized protein LOC106164538 [Lingula anatina]|uniref:Uncharacterized protein LOC106164538 n=1 Tax=Lingula anatina TaxID=7574 RepID=A0A1S3II98_LINAN|nr:uncharacterized protein LOC106164538 [Lingula anatina]|eukprot:XP_013397937.1 uncharacterized protein LOC106164538 [Lingula anatina]
MPGLQDLYAFCLPYFHMLLDWLCRVLLRRRLTPLTEESLWRKFTVEERRVILSESLTRRWWHEGFCLLLKCYREDEDLTVAGRMIVETRWTEILQNRLAISKRLASVDVLKCQIKRPIFIIGPARSGTSFLQSLLYEDPKNTSPRYFEVMHPVEEATSTHAQSRELTEIRKLGSRYTATPELRAIHYIRATGPYECFNLMENMGLFKNFLFFTSNIQDYEAWRRTLTKDQMVEAYRFHKLQMQIIFLARGKDNVLNNKQVIFKESTHAANLEAILKVYPDARFISTYRDPCETTASVCSLLSKRFATFVSKPKNIDLDDFGQHTMRSPLLHGGNEMVRYRKQHPEEAHRFCDVDYVDIVASPMKVVKEIYDFFGLELTALREAKMSTYVTDHPQNKYGQHAYGLKRYNLTEEEVLEYFKEFVEFCRPQ